LRIVIAGGGRLGFHLAKILEGETHDITIIEKDANTVHELNRELKSVIVHGDATRPSVLKEAGVDRCDALVALTGQDETNLVICLAAKHRGAKMTAARLANVQYDDATLEKMGIDIVVYPEAAAAAYVSELLTKPNVLDVAFIARGDAELVEVEVKPGSLAIGKLVKELSPEGANIIAVYDGEKLVTPTNDMTVGEGMRLLLIGKTGKIKNLKKLFGE